MYALSVDGDWRPAWEQAVGLLRPGGRMTGVKVMRGGHVHVVSGTQAAYLDLAGLTGW
ncbi:hypothetical protein O3597_16600 [Verrucosispora sp. WMMA2044]|uniref:Uncharacterized protein n=1 Tax=Verrucosispora sioxanthis TaxID=2499994 RepID=A0A6M1L6V0_9ACTN|nr:MULTISPECIES: hypothetical protein [Micromonospora]NEE62453.1 hypothetical protein [Verrucosispora sioxanthis]NGM11563.1 hypothetical protein [Verrucosispora sioxanthis]WBB46806.1 hypothetical protein O3597_16600 [Verrucosispora sp. WMMA2044]